MLIEFRVENHRSIREEQALTLEAANIGTPDDPRPRKVEGHNQALLPVAAIYGANASGKSNVLAALRFMGDAVMASQRYWDPEGGVPQTPFAWGDSASNPSVFEVVFLTQGIKYQYGFALNTEEIVEEWLYAWPNKHKQTWFTREGDRFKFGEYLEGPNQDIKKLTRPNALFLSAAVQARHETLAPVYRWIRDIIFSNVKRVSSAGIRSFSHFPANFAFSRHQRSLFEDSQEDGYREQLQSRMRELFKSADLGIAGMKTVEEERIEGDEVFTVSRTLFQHVAGDENSWLDLREESAGTQTLFRLVPSIVQVLEGGGLLVVDELESSLHPLLGLEIVKMFNCPRMNPRHAQLIFTTHDTNLLGTTLGDPPLRRDQIWFTEKDNGGSTKLYPLTDYKPRNCENLERGYLQGRYGGIPYLGALQQLAESKQP